LSIWSLLVEAVAVVEQQTQLVLELVELVDLEQGQDWR
jgi:hypothetical protein